MRLELRNIAKIHEANIELDGITVIAGENNTGKSTVGKALYAANEVFYGFDYFAEEDVKVAIKANISNAGKMLDSLLKAMIGPAFRRKNKVIEEIQTFTYASLIEMYENDENVELAWEVMYEYIQKHFATYEIPVDTYDKRIQNCISDIKSSFCEMYSIDKTKIGLLRADEIINSVFLKQVTTIGSDGKSSISLVDDYGVKSRIEIENNKCEIIVNNVYLSSPALYIDNPRITDKVNGIIHLISTLKDSPENVKIDRVDANMLEPTLKVGLRMLLVPASSKLFLNKSLIQKEVSDIEKQNRKEKLGKIVEQLKETLHGSIVSDKGNYIFVTDEKNDKIKLENMSTGMKSFIILEQLIDADLLSEKEIIIFDEPEINLNPSWQLVYAKILVLIQKILNVKIVITTHSPYLLNAIEEYSKKEGISEKCNFYLAENIENDTIISNVSDNIERIYNNLAEPFDILEELESEGTED